MGTPLTPQGESSPIELLNGAINSLQNNAPTQANERVKQLQQVSPATANRIFHLIWELSGKPMHFGSRFGEEAFFGYWGRSIDPTIKFHRSRNRSYIQRQELVAGHRCAMPTVQEYVALCIFTNKVFQKCLLREKHQVLDRRDPQTCGSTSTQVNGYPLGVGGSSLAGLYVSIIDFGYNNKYIGVCGQRKFEH